MTWAVSSSGYTLKERKKKSYGNRPFPSSRASVSKRG